MIKIIKEVTKKDLKEFLYNIDEKDENLYNELNNGGKIGIFQISGNTASKFCDAVKPRNFNEIIAVNSLSRPGVIESSGQAYIKRKQSLQSPYPEQVNEILKDTYYTMLYQEQIMEIFHKIGGFTLEETNDVRSIMKKLSKADKDPEDLKAWEKVIKKFTKGALKLGLSENDVKLITQDLQAFADYSFNKSHATAYSYVALMTLYLSYYFKPYWYSSVLSYEIDKKKYIKQYLQIIRSQGITLLPPDVNVSMAHFHPIDKTHISFGLSGIKGVSDNASEIIIENRPYRDLFDFIIKTRSRTITSGVIKALIKAGAFDWYDKNRNKLLAIFDSFWANKKSIKLEEKLKEIYNKAEERVLILEPKTTINDLVNFEQESFGMRIFISPFSDELLKMFYKLYDRKLVVLDINEIDKYSHKIPLYVSSLRYALDRNENEMAFIKAEDIYGNEITFPIFASYFKFIKGKLQSKKIYIMNLYRSERGFVFGKNEFINNEFEINRLIKEVNLGGKK